MTRNRRRSSLLPSLLILLLGLAIALAALLALGFVLLPDLAEENFGPVSPRLSSTERVLYSGRLFLNRAEILEPVDTGGEAVLFEVELGESVPEMAVRLQNQGLLRSAEAFQTYLIYSGLDTGVQAGQHLLSPALNALQIALALQDATPLEVSFSILPGWRAEEIAAALPTSGLSVTPEDFLRLVHNPAGLNMPAGLEGLEDLEGFLYPDVYRLKREISAEELVLTFVRRFDESVPQPVRAGLEKQGYSLREGVTLASLVQREAVVADEQPMIASVFLNRMRDGMKLDSDPTVQYAVGFDAARESWWVNPLSAVDLQTDSPYNTYLYAGLPPGPICSPPLSAIQAVAFPAQTPYYYFRARCDGSGRHLFAKTYEEHLSNACP